MGSGHRPPRHCPFWPLINQSLMQMCFWRDALLNRDISPPGPGWLNCSSAGHFWLRVGHDITDNRFRPWATDWVGFWPSVHVFSEAINDFITLCFSSVISAFRAVVLLYGPKKSFQLNGSENSQIVTSVAIVNQNQMIIKYLVNLVKTLFKI